jgi:4-amino-4-deoxy-L-arabinose transferase-like glycosyltransferase
MTPRQALWAVIGASTLLRLTWATSLGADTNEAYYYLYAQHPDWSYFDHPPMVAVVTGLGLRLVGGISPVLGVRAGFIALFAGSIWLMARLTSRSFGPRAGALAAFALSVTGYFGLVAGTFAHPDGPLLFFWLLTLDRLAVALAAPDRLRDWLWVGLAWGGALLSKYHGVLLPVGVVLYLILRPSTRRCLRLPGPYLALAVGVALFAPVIGWNAAHGWISFFFQGWRAVGSTGFRPERLAQAIGGQALFLFPWIWAALVMILFRLVRRGHRDWSDPEAFLVCQAVPIVSLFLGVASFRWIMPHWPLIGFVALMPLLGRAWSDLLDAHPRRQWRQLAAIAVVPVVLASLFAVQARLGLFQEGQGRLLGLLAPKHDPTIELISWDQVARELERRELLHTPGTFLFTSSWRNSAHLAFATAQAVPVACYERDARSFAFWSRPEDWVGRDGIFVGLNDCMGEAAIFARWFTRVEPLGEFPILRAGVPVQTVHLYRCIRQTNPFPFGYDKPAAPAIQKTAARKLPGPLG